MKFLICLYSKKFIINLEYEKILLHFLLFNTYPSPQLCMGKPETGRQACELGVRSGIFYQITGEAGNAEVGYNAMLSFSNNGLQLTGLRIIYETALTDISPDLYFAWGYGGHVGFIYTDHFGYFGERYNFQGERFCPVIGADGWVAAEYRFRDIPLNISLNLKPMSN